MKTKSIFPFKIKPGSYEKLVRVLKFPEVPGPQIDDQIFRVTVTDYSLELSVKKECAEQYKSDQVFQVRLLNNNDREFIVLASMLEHLNEPVIVEK